MIANGLCCCCIWSSANRDSHMPRFLDSDLTIDELLIVCVCTRVCSLFN